MYRTSLWLFLLSVALLVTGCDKSGPAQNTRPSEEESVRYSNYSKQDARDKLIRTAQILATVGPNHKAYTSIRKALDLRRKEGYAEDVSFAHLLEEKPAVKSKSNRSKYATVSKDFRTAVNESLAKAEGENSGAFDEGLRRFLVNKGFTIAWVQRGHFEVMPEAPTITYHPLTRRAHEPNSGIQVPGFKPVEGERGKPYTRVMVDEEYVENNPTLVVRPCEAGLVGESVNKYCEFRTQAGEMAILPPGGGGGGGGGGSGGGGGGSSDIDSKSLTDNTKFEVYVSDFQCRQDTDSWISGGPEIRIANAEPKVVSVNPEKVEGDVYEFGIDSFSGDNCDNNVWKSIGTNWTSPWEKGDIRNGLVVWDWDRITTSGSAEFSLTYDGSVKGVDIYATTNATVEYNNGGAWGKIPYARANFVENNATNCNSLGTRNGRCIRGVGSYARFTFGANILE